MYISKLSLNLKSQRVRKEINNSYELHRTIYNCFPEKNNSGPGRILFRVDPTTVNYSIPVLVVSDKRPNWDHLKIESEYLSDFSVKDYKLSLKKGLLLKFRLKANPTVKKNGKRIGIINYDERLNWINRKSNQNGFKLLDIFINSDRMKTSKNNNEITLNSVIYEGVLKITDADKFKNALYKGIGSAKGFGFGLMSIARY